MINYIIEEKIDKNESQPGAAHYDKKVDLDDEKELLQTLQSHHTVIVQKRPRSFFDSLKDCSAYIESCIFQIKDIIELYQKNKSKRKYSVSQHYRFN